MKVSEGATEEGLARDSGEDGLTERVKLMLAGEQGEVFIEGFAEAVAGIEDDSGGIDAGVECRVQALLETGADKGQDFLWFERGQFAPLVRAAASMHKDDAAIEAGTREGHLVIPGEAADVVHDFGTGFDGDLCGRGVPGINGQDGVGARLKDGFNDGQDALLFLVRGDRSVLAGSGGFAADVDDIRAFVEQMESMGGSDFRIEEEAAVGERVGCYVDDAHDESARAEGQGADAQLPEIFVAARKGHTQMMLHSAQR